MSYPVKFNWVLHLEIPAHLENGGVYPFLKPDNRVLPIDTPIDLIDPERQAIAKIKVTEFTQNGKETIGKFTVLKIYNGQEKETLTNYWKENQ